ncbi:hypothetical protein E2562_023744 [Oryza meyeriana var. granulata]|uniref:No apical meristem-associated C-terminal domain-containing protein n=1 Tax=Oryza meyeriana var. granulata TaxID=110450 RepID=A0A6G1DMG7_9ORYZ|nr:hypothetical protein E2562_023744 [Oryza meyeriana var. granulata]
MLKLEPPVFLKMLVFLALVLLELVLLPLVDGGQHHLLAKGYTHQEGSQSSISPIDLGARRTPSPTQETDDVVDDVDAEETETINVDEDSRTDKRLNWTASAWLHNSKDPVDGIGRKAEQYWADVTVEYNKTIENSRKRNLNQLKIRWDRVKKPLTDFHGCWVNTGRVWQSGMSDDQLTDKALEVYAGQNSGKAFPLLHMWKVVRGEQKWSAYLNRLKKEKEKSAKAKPGQVVNLELDGEKRPMGHKKAKNERNGKKKATDALSDFSGKFENFIEASTKNREDREKMIEIQQSLADKKIEAAKLNHEAAHEQTKVAHEQTKCKMVETYTQLLLAPTDQLSADALAERKLALESLRLALFPKVAQVWKGFQLVSVLYGVAVDMGVHVEEDKRLMVI